MQKCACIGNTGNISCLKPTFLVKPVQKTLRRNFLIINFEQRYTFSFYNLCTFWAHSEKFEQQLKNKTSKEGKVRV